jgi:hypothetical protein
MEVNSQITRFKDRQRGEKPFLFNFKKILAQDKQILGI